MKILLSGLVITTALLATHTSSATPTALRFSHVVSELTPKGKTATVLSELIAQQMGDKYKLTVYPNSDLYDDKAVFKALQLGDIHFAAPSLSKFGRHTDKFLIYDLPFIFEDIDAALCFSKKASDKNLFASFEKKGFKILAIWPNGMRQISSKTPIKTPGDIKHKKYRIESSNVFFNNIEILGGLPMKTTWEEALNSIKFGVIDAWENSWPNLYTSDAHRHFPYITQLNHDLQGYALITSTDFWNNLPKVDQNKLSELIHIASAQWLELTKKETQEKMQELKRLEHVEVISLSPDETNAWIKALKPTWAHFENIIGKHNIEAAVTCNSEAYQQLLDSNS